MQDSPVQQIKDRLDIVEVIGGYVRLQKAGANYKALCPFHSEKTPSFFVSPARQIWHCFGACGTGGDIFKFIMQIEGVEFRDALQLLAQRAGVELRPVSPKLKTERERQYEICQWACRFFEKQLEASSFGKKARKYLLTRGISEESIKKWRLGWAPDKWQALSDFLVGRGYKREEVERAGLAVQKPGAKFYDRFRGRIMFPIFDLNSQVIAFAGRIFKKQETRSKKQQIEPAKYINTPNTLLYDKSRVLYGLDKAKLAIRKKNFCILVEGYTDVILAAQAGSENVAATSGTALTHFQLKLLKRYSQNIFTAFDMDVAGASATKRGIDLAQTEGFNIRVIILPKEKDPADLASQSPADWQKAVKEAKSIMEFYFDSAFARFDSQTPENKKELAAVLLPAIKRISNKIEQSHWAQELARRLQVREEDVIEELNKYLIEKSPLIGKLSHSNRSGLSGITSQSNSQSKKSRKDLLEERLLSLILSCSENLDFITDDDVQIFSPKIKKIIEHFKTGSVQIGKAGPCQFGQQTEGLSPDLVDFINYLDLKSEVFPEETEPTEEFQKCLSELRYLQLKDRLKDLCQQIRKAEQEKNTSQVQELTQKYKKILDKLMQLK